MNYFFRTLATLGVWAAYCFVFLLTLESMPKAAVAFAFVGFVMAGAATSILWEES